MALRQRFSEIGKSKEPSTDNEKNGNEMSKKKNPYKNLLDPTEKKKQPEFLALQVLCTCGEVITTKDVSWHAWENPCELCGSHGGVSASTSCPKCKKYIDVELNSY